MAKNMTDSTMTDSLGRPIANDSNSLAVGPEGPILLDDIHFVDKLGHFDRERIPERVVHAKGAGAHGFFQPYRNMEAYTTAAVFRNTAKRTKVFIRFSTVIGSKGSADTVRDPRGFAVKFYTEQGNYDIVGNDLPVFFIRDSIKFPDVIHSLKPTPQSNLKDPCRFWDFVSLTPEAMHMITWVYSDRGTIKDYRHVDGFGVNTYVWVNKEGKRTYVKYHFKTQQGIETICRKEAEKLAGEDPDIATRNLFTAIEKGEFPSWKLCVQMMDPKDAKALSFDPLDDTKTWPEDAYPLIPIGMITLNENPKSFFAETEQAAFCPANLVPGVEFSADKMLQGRIFSYVDTQRHRIGPNFAQLPINRPIVPIHNNQRDGSMDYAPQTENVNYYPNSLNNNQPAPSNAPVLRPEYYQGYVVRKPISKQDNYMQAGERFDSFTQEEKEHFYDNIAAELVQCRADIVDRVLNLFANCSKEWAYGVRQAMQEFRQGIRA